jgi:hypothetical protein
LLGGLSQGQRLTFAGPSLQGKSSSTAKSQVAHSTKLANLQLYTLSGHTSTRQFLNAAGVLLLSQLLAAPARGHAGFFQASPQAHS